MVDKSEGAFEAGLSKVDSGFKSVLRNLPFREDRHLPPNWLHWEMLERYRVLQPAGIQEAMRVLEVGAGAHAIATVPLAHLVGPEGRVVAVERERWSFFRQIVGDAGLEERVLSTACDARTLPFPSETFDLATCVHGIRSLREEAIMVEVFREMLRVAPRLFLTESLPEARNEAQRAHLAMYNLREEVFEAVLGYKDDIHYLPLERLGGLVEEAGGRLVESRVIDVDLPHFLAFLPREYVERVGDDAIREDLLRRWDEANRLLKRYGAEHPPVAVLLAER
ncbi:MAG: class I SAM-dependent methyltransferase [Thermoplasmata archaeon]